MLDFRVLGPLEIVAAGTNIAPTALKPRQVVSLLLLRRNSIVQTSELIDELWEDNPPNSAMTTLQTYIYKLRKLLARHGFGEALRTHASGYSITVPDPAVDLVRFERRLSEGHSALETDDHVRASAILAEALGMWRGPVLMDVATGSLLSAYVTRLEETRIRALELRIQTDLKVNRHAELVSELKSLTMTHPLHENFHQALMVALARSGRRHEALEVYRRLRETLVNELGLEPGRDLQRLHQSLLSAEVTATPADRPAPAGPVHAARPTAVRDIPPAPLPPAQLPSDLADLTGRDEVLAELERGIRAADPAARPLTAMSTLVITGMPGVGKSALAVALAHRLRPGFPDGQLHAELHRPTGEPREPFDVLGELLRGLGVPRQQLADTVAERARQLRSVTSGRRILVVLDDAASTAQLRPLLPGDPGCAVVVTSGRRLSDLAGAHRVVLDPLTPADGVELLARILGCARVERDGRAARWLVEAADGLPLALRCIGGRLAAMPDYSPGRLAEELAKAPRLLAAMSFGDLDVRSRFDAAHDRLDPLDQGILRLLSALPVAGFTAGAAAGLLGWEEPVMVRLLERLHEHNLLRANLGPRGVAYGFPRLVGAHARDRLAETLLDRWEVASPRDHSTLAQSQAAS